MPALIEGLETELAALHTTMAAAEYYRKSGDVLAHDQERLRDLEGRLREAFARWEALEDESA